jgi:homocysteine S-methyltransferase
VADRSWVGRGRNHRPSLAVPLIEYHRAGRSAQVGIGKAVHSSVLREALRSDERLRRLAGVRLLDFKANASRRPPEELEGLDRLEAEAPNRLAEEMVALRDEFGLKVLGGCCGTGDRHIAALAGRLMEGGR